jgi:RNA polymerase sigma-70 factor (ECF subfamily)
MREPSLLSRARGGEMSAFEALVECHRDGLYSFARRMAGSETEAAEIVQESFLSVYLHLSEFRNESEFVVWLLWIAATHASLRLRLQPRVQAVKEELKSPKFHPSGALAHSTNPKWNGNTDQLALSAELRRAIEDATDALPWSYREVFLLKDLAGLSYEEIANITAQSVPAIKDRVHQARLSLRETIDGFYSKG